jgi:hypothetical protein
LNIRATLKVVSLFYLAALVRPVRGQETFIGSVKSLHGSALILRGQDSIPIKEGAHLLPNDGLRTAQDGGIGVILQDGTRLSLGPNTELKIDRYVYQPVDGKFGLLLKLARGALAYVSGKIAQFAPASVSVETPVAILGLRGTEFAVSLDGAVEANGGHANAKAGI